jgi:hypothetical protein
MEAKNLYFVYVWDGGERAVKSNIVFSNENAAKVYKQKHKYDTIQKETVVIIDTYEEYQEYKSGEVKRKALLKLTKEERVALGFTSEVE